VPLPAYLEIYRDVDPEPPFVGEWAKDRQQLPYQLQAIQENWSQLDPAQVAWAQRAVYALCTHIDHQIRLLLGSLREEELLEDTYILFTSDHGDMLGDHGLKNGTLFYESSACIPMILVAPAGDSSLGHGREDDRLVELRDVMPTLLELAGIDTPESVEGISMLGQTIRPYLYGEMREGLRAGRMIHDGRFKLIYYTAGNRRQLFDLENDPRELIDLAGDPDHANVLASLTGLLIDELYGGDREWIEEGRLVGVPDEPVIPGPDHSYNYQRGQHWPPPDREWTGY
jgi:arylsulfatase A-like enzyme